MSDDKRVSEVRTVQSEPDSEQRVFTFKATQLIWLLFGVLEVLIALRVGLRLIGANPGSPIVVLIYGFTDLFLFPFRDIVISPSYGNLVLELPSLFAMVIFGLIAWVLERLVWLIFYRPRGSMIDTTRTISTERHTKMNP